MLILGIDPGSRRTGWGVLNWENSRYRYIASGTLRLEAAPTLSQRLLRLNGELESLLTLHRPECCAIERIFSARNPRSALVLGHARGVILYAVANRGIPMHEYAATHIKQAVVGSGRASKLQIQRMVRTLLGRPAALQEDEADALAVAITHAAAARMRKLP